MIVAFAFQSWWPLIAMAGAGYVLFRGGGFTAINALQAANTELKQRVQDLESEDRAKAKRIAELEARTDVSLAILPVLNALRLHEVEAAKRSDATLKVLELIAERFGPEHE